jgi:hypothetical protein
MGSAKDALKMDYSQVWLSIFMDFRFHHLEASFFLWFIANHREPLNESRWITDIHIKKGEEQEHTANVQSTHAWQFWSHVDENTVISRVTFLPS